MGTVTSYKTRPLWSGLISVVWLAVISALLGAFVNVMDTFVINKGFLAVDQLPLGFVITSEIIRTNVLAYLILGSWVGILVNIAFNHTIGKTLQKDFTRERWVSWKAQKSMFLTGFLAACFTMTLIYVATGRDPSYLIALSGFNIVWLVLYEALRGKTAITNMAKKLVLIALAIVGSILTSLENIELGQFRWEPVLLMTIVVGITMAISRIIETETCEDCGGEVNFNFWRFLWLGITGTSFALLYCYFTNTLSLLLETLKNRALIALVFVLITMLLAYGNNLLRIKAEKHSGKGNADRVSIILSSQAVFAVPLGIIAWKLLPNIYSFPQDPVVWALRGLGVFLVLVGVLILEKMRAKLKD